MHDVGAHELFIADLSDEHASVAAYNHHVVDVRAVPDELVFAQCGSDKALGAVDVQLGVGDGHLGRHNLFKAAELCFALAPNPVLLLQVFKELNGVINQIIKVMLNLCNLAFECAKVVICLVGVELRNALDSNLCQPHDVLVGDRAQQVLGVRSQPHTNVFHDRLPGFGLFDVAVDAVLDKDLLKAGKVPLLVKLVELELELCFEHGHRRVGGPAEHVAHPHKHRLIVDNDAGHGAHRRLAGRERVERIHHLVGRNPRQQMDHNLHVLCRVVLDLFDLDLAFVVGLDHGLDH